MWAAAAVTGLAIGAFKPLGAVFAVMSAAAVSEPTDLVSLAKRCGVLGIGAVVGALVGQYRTACIVLVAVVQLSIRLNVPLPKPEVCPSPPRCYL